MKNEYHTNDLKSENLNNLELKKYNKLKKRSKKHEANEREHSV